MLKYRSCCRRARPIPGVILESIFPNGINSERYFSRPVYIYPILSDGEGRGEEGE